MGACADKAAGSASEMDVDTFDTEYKAPGKGKQKLYEVEFETLSQADVKKIMHQDVENISGICGVDVSIVTPSLLLVTCLFICSSFTSLASLSCS